MKRQAAIRQNYLGPMHEQEVPFSFFSGWGSLRFFEVEISERIKDPRHSRGSFTLRNVSYICWRSYFRTINPSHDGIMSPVIKESWPSLMEAKDEKCEIHLTYFRRHASREYKHYILERIISIFLWRGVCLEMESQNYRKIALIRRKRRELLKKIASWRSISSLILIQAVIQMRPSLRPVSWRKRGQKTHKK